MTFLAVPLSSLGVVDGIAFDHLRDSPAKQAVKSTVRFLMETEKGIEHLCSGVIVADRQILSAAHCFNAADVKQAIKDGKVTMVFRNQNPPEREDRIKLDQDAVRLSPQGNIDLAMVSVPLEFPKSQKIPIGSSGCRDKSPYIVAGYGTSREAKTPTDLQKLPLRSVRLEKSAEGDGALIPMKRTLSKRTGKSHGMGCFGDSGGPTFCKDRDGKWVLAGINARVYPTTEALKSQTLRAAEKCETSTFFSATSVRYNIDIIRDWMSAQPSPSGGSRELNRAAPR